MIDLVDDGPASTDVAPDDRGERARRVEYLTDRALRAGGHLPTRALIHLGSAARGLASIQNFSEAEQLRIRWYWYGVTDGIASRARQWMSVAP